MSAPSLPPAIPPALAAGIAEADAMIRAARTEIAAGHPSDLSALDTLMVEVCEQARDPALAEAARAPVRAALDKLLADLNVLEREVEAARAKAARAKAKKERDRGR